MNRRHGDFGSCKDHLPKATRRRKATVVLCVCGNLFVGVAYQYGYGWKRIKTLALKDE